MRQRRHFCSASLALAAGLAYGCASDRSDRSLAQHEPSSAAAGNSLLADGNLSGRYTGLASEFPGHVPGLSQAQVEQLAAAAQGEAPSKNPFTKAASAVKGSVSKTASFFTFKPRVEPAVDPISLAYDPGPIGEEVFMQVGRLHEKQGNLEAARNQYQKALEVKPKDLTILLSYARVCDLAGDYDAALATYRQASELHPSSGLALNDMALCMARHGAIDQSLVMLQRAIEMEPQSQRYRNNIATVLVESGRPDEALGHLQAVHPESVAYYNVGVLLHQRGRNEQSFAYLTRAAELDPSLAAVQAMLARLPVSRPTTPLNAAANVRLPAAPGQPPVPGDYTAIARAGNLAPGTPPAHRASYQPPVAGNPGGYYARDPQAGRTTHALPPVIAEQ